MKIPGKSILIKGAAFFACAVLSTAPVFAAGPPQPSVLTNSLAIVLLVVIIALLLAIALLANVVLGAAQINLERQKEQQKQDGTAGKIFSTIILLFISTLTFAQDAEPAAAAVAPTTYGGLSAGAFYMLSGIIALEFLVLLVLLAQLRSLLAKDKPVVVQEAAESKTSKLKLWWEKMNSFKPAHEEKKIELGHSYDGIRELDNDLPKWWLYGFYLCIFFSGIYLYRFHVSGSGPSSEQEYLAEVAKADIEKEAYLKKAANKVDENTVVLITDAMALAEGKKLFGASCAPCHGPEGGGVVGPNLTDNYWLHNGSVKDVFKVIKYGVPEKGMKSWKDDFSPVQIANITSFIKSIHGTNPANAKEPQGELYTEESENVSDSTKAIDKKLAIK